MNDELALLRAAAEYEVGRLESGDIEIGAPPNESLEDVLLQFFVSHPPSGMWLTVVDSLAQSTAVVGALSGTAAKTARVPRQARPITVEAALKVSLADARRHLHAALRLSHDAAEEFLERPAASLAIHSPEDVRHLADLAHRPLGELFDDIASSWRAGGNYVYAYRAGAPTDEPATTVSERDMASLVAWGSELFR